MYFPTLSSRVVGSGFTGSILYNIATKQINLKTMATLFSNAFSGSKRDPKELVYTSALL